jgi:hypothetical protein
VTQAVPPPRKHRHRYHGVFAPNHPLRPAVTALAVGNVGKHCDPATGGHAVGGHAAGQDTTVGDSTALIRKLVTHPKATQFAPGSRTTLLTRPPLSPISAREYTPARSALRTRPDAHCLRCSILSPAVTATGTTFCAA